LFHSSCLLNNFSFFVDPVIQFPKTGVETLQQPKPVIPPRPSKPVVQPKPVTAPQLPKVIVDTTPKPPDSTIFIGLLQLESQVATLLASASASSFSSSQKKADQETLIAAVPQRLQENEKKLAKEDHAKKSAALDDLARQFDERLKLMEKERKGALKLS